MAELSFVPAEDAPRGERARRVAGILDRLADAEGEPVPFAELCEELGIEQPSQLLPAMHALEFVCAVDRFTYNDGGTKAKVAYALSENVEVLEIADTLEED